MNTTIEIHDNNTNKTGTYSVWFRDLKGELHSKILSENDTDSLLDMRQKEKFFMGQFKFKISEYDFKKVFLEPIGNPTAMQKNKVLSVSYLFDVSREQIHADMKEHGMTGGFTTKDRSGCITLRRAGQSIPIGETFVQRYQVPSEAEIAQPCLF